MLRKLVVFAFIALSISSLGAIDVPPPECFPCDNVSSR